MVQSSNFGKLNYRAEICVLNGSRVRHPYPEINVSDTYDNVSTATSNTGQIFAMLSNDGIGLDDDEGIYQI
jgi:hypothetical protein